MVSGREEIEEIKEIVNKINVTSNIYKWREIKWTEELENDQEQN